MNRRRFAYRFGYALGIALGIALPLIAVYDLFKIGDLIGLW